MKRAMLAAVAALICVCVIGVVVPAHGAAGSDDINLARWRLAEQLDRLGIAGPLVDRIRHDDDVVFRGRFRWPDPAGDLDRDGVSDLFLTTLDYRIEFSDNIVLYLVLGFSFEGRTKIEAISGATGDTIWVKRHDGFAGVVAAPVGAPARDGALWIYQTESTSGPVTSGEIVYEGLSGSGKALWRRAIDFQYAQTSEGYAVVDSPLWSEPASSVGNRATDMLVTTGDYAATWLGTAARTTVSVIDGSDGSIVEHPLEDITFNWDPTAWAVGDLNKDGYQDYVLTRDSGSGSNDVVMARSGVDGSSIWSTTNHDFSQLAWIYPISDLTGNGTNDLLITTRRSGWQSRFVEGDKGRARWWAKGLWPYVPGDIDRDGEVDVITRTIDHHQSSAAVGAFARNGSGKELWSRVIRTPLGKDEPCQDICFTFMATGLWEVGDLDGDGLTDMFVHHEVERDAGEDMVRRHTVLASDGSKGFEGGRSLYAIGGSVDGAGADLAFIEVDGDTVTIRAADGRDMSPLWKSHVRLDGSIPRRAYIYILPMHIDGDRCVDPVLVTTTGKRGAVLALSDSGELLWDLTAGVSTHGATVETPPKTSC